VWNALPGLPARWAALLPREWSFGGGLKLIHFRR